MSINRDAIDALKGLVLGRSRDVYLQADGSGHLLVNGVPSSASYATTASAAAMPVPSTTVVLVTGTTNITSIAAGGVAGQKVTYIFASTPTFTDGSNLKLAGNLVATADDTITLVCDGTSWFEIGRSVN
jgi:hypothetical protein